MSEKKKSTKATDSDAPENEKDTAKAAPAEAETAAEEDPWAAALAEQAASEDAVDSTPEPAAAPVPAPESPRNASTEVFQPLSTEGATTKIRDLDMVMDIPVKLTVELGRTRITIKQLLELSQGSVVELDGLPGEPMDILINGYLIAQGEVVVVDDRFGIRITEIVTPSERLQRLNR